MYSQIEQYEIIQKRTLRQQMMLLLFTSFIGISLFLGLSIPSYFGSSSGVGLIPTVVHRFQLALYLAFLVDFTAMMGLVFLLSTGFSYDPVTFHYRETLMKIVYVPIGWLIMVAGGLFCWVLWELALLYQHIFNNKLFSENFAFIPIGGFTALVIWALIGMILSRFGTITQPNIDFSSPGPNPIHQ